MKNPTPEEARKAAAESARQIRDYLSRYGAELSPEQRAKHAARAAEYLRQAGVEAP